LFGFSTLVILIAFSGFSALERAAGSYAGTSQLYAEELRTEQELGRLRSDILLSAIALRDLLMNPSEGTSEKRAELHRLESSSRTGLRSLHQLIPAEYHDRLAIMERAVTEYWGSLAALPGSERALQTEILPRRMEVMRLAEQIEALTRDSIRKQREEIDRRQADLPYYIAEIVGATLLVGLLVSATSVIRIAHLEKMAAGQHRAVLDAEEELRRLSQQMVLAQEEERKSLSRDLHDQIGQVLTALRIGIGNLEGTLREKDSGDSDGKEKVQVQVDQAKRLAEQALRSVRDIAMGLRPAMLDDLGLGAALEWQARQFSRLSGVPVSVTVEGELEKCSDAQRTCIYRVVQEALNNVAKHARASEVMLLVKLGEAGIRIEVSDNGKGFEAGSRKNPGLGLVGIKERVRQLGGDADVESKPSSGTALRVWLPLHSRLESA
jgi:signal transduction histidine kinase